MGVVLNADAHSRKRNTVTVEPHGRYDLIEPRRIRT